MSLEPPYRCICCGQVVFPNAKQIEEIEAGRITALAHLGELVELSERRPLNRDEMLYSMSHLSNLGIRSRHHR